MATTDNASKFSPRTPSNGFLVDSNDNDGWRAMLESDCSFDGKIFNDVMLNLIRNPNIMSSHLFRADVLYDSDTDSATLLDGPKEGASLRVRGMKPELRPRYLDLKGWRARRTFVRQLVPRNRQLDKDLVQTCHFYEAEQTSDDSPAALVIYIPHVESQDDMPWYHPKVHQLAFVHRGAQSSISVHFRPFRSSNGGALDDKLHRTALRLLQMIHKHGQGHKDGYTKRVHHDQIIEQARFQDTYARLKAKYAKALIGGWVEQTDPGKHVFEDLGIASFLIELWADMYDDKSESKAFPGFIDIGCGNGLLVHLLTQEGYQGWGFDARRRKTWDTFPSETQSRLKQMILVPQIYLSSTHQNGTADSHEEEMSGLLNSADMKQGTFIISNHADELTVWTPLLAHMSGSPFIAIPCCSHDLAGARFRAPPRTAMEKARLPAEPRTKSDVKEGEDQLRTSSQAAETGSLKRPPNSNQMPSAYSSLCDYVSAMARDVGFEAEKEMLRIPSTRNACILGRRRRQSTKLGPLSNEQIHQREQDVLQIVSAELRRPIHDISKDWLSHARQIAGKKSDGH